MCVSIVEPHKRTAQLGQLTVSIHTFQSEVPVNGCKTGTTVHKNVDFNSFSLR